IVNDSLDNEYYCYISMEDTSNEGGYRILPHKFDKFNKSNVICNPKYVISFESFEQIQNEIDQFNKFKCPICYKELDINFNSSLLKVPPKKYVNNNININYNIYDDIYYSENHENIDLSKMH